jgi:16S rRNA (adenine1518-N6/adenine1519-N6)-dimethyltransferase
MSNAPIPDSPEKTPLRDLVARYGIRLKKGLGQNLLLDDNINAIMVDAAALTRDDQVVEVGAGLGALTQRLLGQAGQVLAIEIDTSFAPCLQDRFGDDPRFQLFRGDVLNHELSKLLHEFLPDATQLKAVSNLPYYITTPLLFHFWESGVPFERMVVMVQEEVAERLVAPVNAANYGVLSLAAQYYSEVDIVHRVPRTCFKPVPKVDSCIVRLRAREAPLYPDVSAASLFAITRAAFSQRRKTLRNALTRSGHLDAPKDDVLAAMEEAGVDPGQRPQTLELDAYAAIARALAKRTGTTESS